VDQIAVNGSNWHRLATDADEFDGENWTNEPAYLCWGQFSRAVDKHPVGQEQHAANCMSQQNDSSPE
jgi:hypothetical protein